MFSALKKLTGGNRSPDPGGSAPPTDGIHHMPTSLQNKFARGVHYNLKLILKGDRNTGKSCLFQRLQGGTFREEYTPTDEIQVTSIQWNYKATDDIVKVEVWDIVDKGKKRKKLEGLKLSTESGADLEPALDAEFVDVYKGTHGVVMMLDITKHWTFEYVQREVPKVPKHIPILILANFCDQAHHRTVTRDQVLGFIDHFDRSEGTAEVAEIRYAEASMRNGFGLKFLHKFLNLPFLTLQRQSLIQQLQRNKEEIVATQEELNLYLESSESNYDHFLENLTKQRRKKAETHAPAPTVDVVVGQLSNTIDPVKSRPTAPVPAVLPKSKSPSPAAVPSTVKPTLPNPSTVAPSSPLKSDTKSGGKIDVDDFVPDASTIDNFLDDETSQASNSNRVLEEDSDDDTAVNPMVAGFEDEVELDDYQGTNVVPAADSSDDDVIPGSAVSLKVEDIDEDAPPSIEGLRLENHDEEKGEKQKSKKKKKSAEKKHRKKTKEKTEEEERNELEEFLNGMPEAGGEGYEAI